MTTLKHETEKENKRIEEQKKVYIVCWFSVVVSDYADKPEVRSSDPNHSNLWQIHFIVPKIRCMTCKTNQCSYTCILY